MTDLKPCPFCGGPAEIVDAVEAGENARVVCCKTCLASSRVIFALKDDVTFDLVCAWNRRTPTRDEILEEAAGAVENAGYYCVPPYDETGSLPEQIDYSAAAIRAMKGGEG